MNHIKKISAFIAAAAAISSSVFLSPPVLAFDYGYRAENYFYTYQIDDVVRRSTWENEKKYGKAVEKAKSKKSTANPKSDEKKTEKTAANAGGADRYTHSNRLSRQINEEMLQTLRQDLQAKNRLTPQVEESLKQMAGADLIGQVKQALKSDGYEPDSVAVAMAYWMLINYGIAQQEDLSKLKGHGLVQQLQAAMADGDMAASSDADKQKMAERLYWMGSLQMAMYMEALKLNKPQAIEARVSDAKLALGHMGLGVNNIGKGRNGLELR